MKSTVTTIIGLLFGQMLLAQPPQGRSIPDYAVPIVRQLLHDNINKEQLALLASDGKEDKAFEIEGNENAAMVATDAITHQVDWLKYSIETSKNLEPRVKIGYLIGLADILRHVRTGWKDKKAKQRYVDPTHIAQIIALYKKLIEINDQKASFVPYLQLFPYDIVYTSTLPRIFEENPSYKYIRDMALVKYCKQYPSQIFNILPQYLDSPSTDSLIKVAGKNYPAQLYTHAQANDPLSRKIKNIKDDEFVNTVVGLSEQKSGQIYFPFLDNLVKRKITVAQLDVAKDDKLQYYRLLVQTQMDYARRAINGDTAIGFKDLTTRLEKKAQDDFVTEINGLHEEPDAIRFRCLQLLTPEELYYLAVLSDGLIYTSSYTNGVFPLMMQKANNRGDSLLLNLHFDHYRKFISQAAAYNKLKIFFASFRNPNDATNLMTTFVSGLEKSKGLEDGVDVADSYASVYETLPDLAKRMLVNIKSNYQRNIQINNSRGIAIYKILYKLFLSADSTQNINLTKELGIPPVYNVPIKSLMNDKGEIITQMFFYGDEDGMTDFGILKNSFSKKPGWTVDDTNKMWIVVKSTKGIPIYIYTNRPLPNEDEQDYPSQSALEDYMDKNNLKPTITFHRGHSYHATTTIGYMAPSSKIVFMGSCGGFNLIDSILKKSSDAHIISSKQTGKRDINLPFIEIMVERLRNNQDIDWIPFWKEFRVKANVSGLEDYIPPYKNLGALFIKAYKKATGEEEE